MIKETIMRIKRKEGFWGRLLYDITKSIANFNLPVFKPLYKFLYYIEIGVAGFFGSIMRIFYHLPVFKTLCFKAGKNTRLIDGRPFIGENIKVTIGDNVRIYGSASFQGFKVFDNPELIIGNNTFIGPDVRVGAGRSIKIGNDCLIAARVFIADHDGHPLDAQKRSEGLPPNKKDIKPIKIEDNVWLGEGVFVNKGVKIGKGAVVAARSVVTKDVEPFTVVAGSPAKVIRKLVQTDNENP